MVQSNSAVDSQTCVEDTYSSDNFLSNIQNNMCRLCMFCGQTHEEEIILSDSLQKTIYKAEVRRERE